MNDAQSAILDIKSALDEFGSSIIFRKVTQGVYNPLTGLTDTYSDESLKAFINKNASEATQRAFSNDYERSITFYTESIPTKQDKIVFNNEEYKILYVSPTILQDTILKYEVLISR